MYELKYDWIWQGTSSYTIETPIFMSANFQLSILWLLFIESVEAKDFKKSPSPAEDGTEVTLKKLMSETEHNWK